MSAQGWKPGEYLGAENASHSEHYTAANASHIRILLREENLGLGAQVGKGNADTFGLSLFSGVLGRLNGKSDAELQKLQSAMRDAELRTYQANKHGLMNFVSGGLLVGDTIKPVEQHRIGGSRKRPVISNDCAQDTKAKKQKSEGSVIEAEQRRIANSTEGEAEINDDYKDREGQKRRRRERERSSAKTRSSYKQEFKDTQTRHLDMRSPASINGVKTGSVDKKSRERRMKSRQQDEMQELSTDYAESDKTRLKTERRTRKERRMQKAEKRRSKSSKQASISETAESEESHGDEAPTVEGTARSALHANRHAVRRRYIDQKRMTSLNPQALKEIFMLKATRTASRDR